MTGSRADVAVTGLGVVAPGGLDVDGFWASLLTGRSFAQRLEVMEDPMFGRACGLRGG